VTSVGIANGSGDICGYDIRSFPRKLKSSEVEKSATSKCWCWMREVGAFIGSRAGILSCKGKETLASTIAQIMSKAPVVMKDGLRATISAKRLLLAMPMSCPKTALYAILCHIVGSSWSISSASTSNPADIVLPLAYSMEKCSILDPSRTWFYLW
jgi:hypothetical protein